MFGRTKSNLIHIGHAAWKPVRVTPHKMTDSVSLLSVGEKFVVQDERMKI